MRSLGHETEYRGEALMKRVSKIRIAVAGCGALGSNLLDTLGRQGFRNLVAVDDDRVEESNLGIQCFRRKDVGRKKADMMQKQIHENLGFEIGTVLKRIDGDNVAKVFRDVDLIVDCFDNSQSRRVLTDYGLNNNVHVLHIGLYEGYGEVVWNDVYRVPNDAPPADDNCETPLARNIAMLAVTVAAESIVEFTLSAGNRKSFKMTLSDRKVLPYQ